MKFKNGNWNKEIDVRDCIQKNYSPYLDGSDFLVGPSERTIKLWEKCKILLKKELINGVLDIETEKVSGVNEFDAGYIDESLELIVGLQTDAPLKRIVNIYGGKRMVETSLEAYGYTLNKNISEILFKYLKTHNEGVFDGYTEEMKLARKAGLLTGLPDSYGRGRIIGDYRRVALYGIDFLVQEKFKDLQKINGLMDYETIELREKVNEQIRSLYEIKEMAKKYGYDISSPATNSKEAVQWLYFAYLAAVKENNGAAMSLGRTSTFLDIYIEKDLSEKRITEEEAQELIDQFVIKLRLVRQLRTKSYDELFAGDPTWVTESLGGMGEDGRTLVTKTTYRFLNSLYNLGAAPEPNLTVLWSDSLPLHFKKYCAKVSIDTDSIQYENDDIMRPIYGDDYGIACCVSAMKMGKQMQYFGARCNLAKALLYSINGGYDEILETKVLNGVSILKEETLDYEKVIKSFDKVLKMLANLYSNTMNVIHHMHDKYAYEKSQMSLHDTYVERLMAFGVAGLSVVVDSLSAIKYAKVKPIRNNIGVATSFEIEGDFPKFGNDDDRVDEIAVAVTDKFYKYLSENKLINNAKHTLSILTITSNVVYGKKTGTTPDGRKAGEPFAPGANPYHGRDTKGALASLNSVAKIKYSESCRDGISNTFSIVPEALGQSENERINNLVGILDGYFGKKAHHLNVNVLNKEVLIDAMNNPDKYPTLTIRVSGYAVNFNRLSLAHQLEVINRTFHEK